MAASSKLTHAVAGTDDVTYGCSADQSLSNSNKLINADNYNASHPFLDLS